MTLEEIRAKFPQYNDLSDMQLADGMYRKFYSDMPREQFDAKIGLKPDTFTTGEILPFSRNERTGDVSLAMPKLFGVTDLATGKTPLQAVDQATGEMHTNPEAVSAAAMLSPASAGRMSLPLLAKAKYALPKVPAKVPAPPPVPVPTSSEWQTAKSIAYKSVDESGARYAQPSFNRLVDQLETRMTGDKFNPRRHPKAASMLDELKEAKGSSPSLTELDQWRQVVRRDVKGDEAEGHFAGLMTDAIDDFISDATMKDMVGGNPRAAADAILTARSANAKYRKLETIEDALKKAERQAAKAGSGGNIDNAIRQQIDSILRNRKLSRFYTKAEKEAMEKVVNGGDMQNFARWLGKMSPEGNGLALLLHTLTGIPAAIASGGLSTGLQIPLAVGGFVAKRYADKATRQNVDDLSRLIGGQ